MTIPRLNPPPRRQSPPARPNRLWLTYVYGRVIADCAGKFNYAGSAKLRLWFSFNQRYLHKQIVAVADLKDGEPITLFIESISAGGGHGAMQFQLADFGHLIIKAQADLVVATSPDTAPLVSKLSDKVSVRILN